MAAARMSGGSGRNTRGIESQCSHMKNAEPSSNGSAFSCLDNNFHRPSRCKGSVEAQGALEAGDLRGRPRVS